MFDTEIKCKYCGGERNPKHSFFNSNECCVKCWKEGKYKDDPKWEGTGYDKYPTVNPNFKG